MNTKNRINKNWMVGLGLALAGTLAAPAYAQSGTGTGVHVLKIDDGISIRQNVEFLPNGMVRARRNGGAGNEHISVAQDGNMVLAVYASTNVNRPQPAGEGISAVKCAAIQMSDTAPPTVVARGQLTNIAGDRLGHPYIGAIPGTGRFFVAYGQNNVQNNNTATWGLVVDAACKDLTGNGNQRQHVRLNADANNNEAAPRAVFDGKKFFFGYYSNNNNRTYVETVGIVQTANGYKPQLLSQATPTINSNIGRPTLVAMSDTRGLVCAPRGNNRPSEGGDQCFYMDTTATGTQLKTLWKQIIVQAAPDPKNIGGIDGLPGPLGGRGVYPASPTVAKLSTGEVVLSTFISTGEGRNRNKKGSSYSYITKLAITDTGATKMYEKASVALENSHVVATVATVGEVGKEKETVALMASPVTGFGSASITHVDPSTKDFAQVAAVAVSPTRADGGYLNNMLGRNPNTQGREHANVYGNIMNLGYGKGFMPKVKSFMVAPWTGRVNINTGDPTKVAQVKGFNGQTYPEDRNAAFLSFIPAVRDVNTPAPPPPAPAGDPGSAGGTPPTGGPGDPGDPGTPGTPGTPAMAGFAGGCSMNATSPSTGAGALVLLGIGLLFLVSRRRWS